MSIDLTQLFQTIVKTGISDIHFRSGAAPMIRLHGRMLSTGFTRMTGEHIEELANMLMTEEQRIRFHRDKELDMSYEVPGVSRFRVNIYRQRGSVALSLRVIPLKLKQFDELNLPADTLKKLCANTRGLVLVAGITGSGKTTTLNAMVDQINKDYAYNIITIEDPVEFFHTDDKSSIAQREVGRDTESFPKALRYVLRQDPDVLVLGEMRDAESIQAGITAAETGHLVLSTVHTMNSAQTLDRLVEAYEGADKSGARVRVANVLKGVIGQRLLASPDGSARYPATEILVVTPLVRKLMMEGKTADIEKAIEQGQYYGMHTFDQDILRLVQEGKVSPEEALDAASNPDDLSLKMKGFGSA